MISPWRPANAAAPGLARRERERDRETLAIQPSSSQFDPAFYSSLWPGSSDQHLVGGSSLHGADGGQETGISLCWQMVPHWAGRTGPVRGQDVTLAVYSREYLSDGRSGLQRGGLPGWSPHQPRSNAPAPQLLFRDTRDTSPAQAEGRRELSHMLESELVDVRPSPHPCQ